MTLFSPNHLNGTGPITLSAGPLSLTYENGYVRSVRVGEAEVVRRIYMALRDEFRNTIPGVLSGFSIAQNDASFFLSFDSRHMRKEIDFLWHGEIKGDRSGELSFSMQGTALSSFRRNRIGFCVLHPLSTCKGKPCRIETIGGAIIDTSFPETVAPFPLFTGLRSMRHPVTDGLSTEIRFEGDVFESEDQRNWTDASYKTYSTPVSLPTPVLVEAGSTIIQRIIVRLETDLPGRTIAIRRPVQAPPRIIFREDRPITPFPSIGALQGEVQNVGEESDAPTVSHFRTEVRFGSEDIVRRIGFAQQLHLKHATPIELALHFTGDLIRELVSLERILGSHPFVIDRFLVYKQNEPSTSSSVIAAAHDTLRRIAPGASIMSGTDGHFVEINRSRPPVDLLDGVCFSATPQVHTFDDAAIMENLPGLLEAIHAAHGIAGHKKVAVSPVTLRPRKRPDRPEKDGGPDGRMRTMFGAAWVLGVIANCIEGKVSSVTLEEMAGRNCRNPGGPAGKTPVEILLSWMPHRHKGEIFAKRSGSSDSARVLALELCANDQFLAVAANLTDAPLLVSFSGVPKKCGYLVLDEDSCKTLAAAPDPTNGIAMMNFLSKTGSLELTLPPYAVVNFSGPIRNPQ